MDETERHLWIAVAALAGLVFTLLIWGPMIGAYRDWKIRRAFRQRKKPYERAVASRSKPGAWLFWIPFALANLGGII